MNSRLRLALSQLHMSSSGPSHSRRKTTITMSGYATWAHLGQRKMSSRIVLLFLLLLAYVFIESLVGMNSMMNQQDIDSRRTFGGELLGLANLMSSDKVPMHVCRAGDQILRMPAKVPGFLIVSNYNCLASVSATATTESCLTTYPTGGRTEGWDHSSVHATQYANRCHGVGSSRDSLF